MGDATQNDRDGAGRDVARSASVISLAVLASRVLGLVREQAFAAFFGAGAAFDAFVTAFRIPNLFRDLLAEGALSAAFVKAFSQRLEKEGEARAWELARIVLTAFALVVGLLVVAGVLAAPWLVKAIASGFDPEKQELAVRLTRVMFPFLLLVSLSAVAMGVLNTRGIFLVPALAGAAFNVGSLFVGLAAAWLFEPDFMARTAGAIVSGESIPRDTEAATRAIVGMAVGVLAGGLLQLLIQTPKLRGTGFRFRPELRLSDPGLRQVFALMVPAVIGAAATQVNVFVNTNFASSLEDGAISWLNYAFRLMQFPIGIFGVAIATATLPSIARAAARGERDEFRATLASSLRLTIFLTLPSAVGLIVLGDPIIALIYERGSFAAADTVRTSSALAGYAIGLVGYSLVKVLAPAFYAVDDAATPARISLLSIGLNVALCFVLVGPFGHTGLAISTATVASANALLLVVLLWRKVGSLQGRRMTVSAAKVVVASAALAVATHASWRFVDSLAGGSDLLERLLSTFIPITVGGVAFLAVARLLGCEELSRLRGLVRR